MTSFTFVQAADLHLDAPFRGLCQNFSSGSPAERSLTRAMQEATVTTLQRLVSVCLHVKADILLLAGDIYNSTQGSLNARLALQEAFTTLDAHQVRVFMAHGNHDPLPATASAWPKNVTVFGAERSVHTVQRNNEPLALVQGVSHPSRDESRNLARLLHRQPPDLLHPDVFQIGVLHCAVQGSQGQHAPYAPCTTDDIFATGLDFCALGHVHTMRSFFPTGSKTPYAAYSGSTQGLHVNESGLHGCMVGKVTNKRLVSHHFVPLAPVVWQQLTIDISTQPESTAQEMASDEEMLLTGEFTPTTELDPADELIELETVLTPALQAMHEKTELMVNTAQEHTGCAFMPEHTLVRLTLTGRTPLYSALCKQEDLATLAQHTTRHSGIPGLLVRDIINATQPALDLATLRQRHDLVGETCRLAEALAATPALLEKEAEAINQQWSRRINKKHTCVAEATPQDLAPLIEEAHLLCLSLLEVE